MNNTKEKIMEIALTLFSNSGYDAVSVRDIAGELGITQAAIYKHYASKHDILDNIILRMERRDTTEAHDKGVPEVRYEDSPESYSKTEISQIKAFSRSMYDYWTKDAFARRFRLMLTVEQYKNEEMSRLYNEYIGGGVISYLADIFRQYGFDEPRRAALSFYAPIFLAMNQYDHTKYKKQIDMFVYEHIEKWS